MNSKINLKPCPFCGSSNVKLEVHYIAMIHCRKCHAIMSFGGKESAQKTIEAYNSRQEDEPCTTKP